MSLSMFLLALVFHGCMLANLAFFPQEYAVEEQINIQCERDAELHELKKEPFIAISLGQNCFPAFHLRDNGLRIRSFPFDWDITPFDALYNIILNDFEGFFDLKNLAINHAENTVYNKKYQFKLNHDFDIVDWLETQDGLAPVHAESLSKYHKVVAYYNRRIVRFYDIFSLGIPIYLFRRVISAAQALKLDQLLKSKFPTANFTLVCIQDEQWDALNAWQHLPSNIILYRFSSPVSHNPDAKHQGMVQIFLDLGLLSHR